MEQVDVCLPHWVPANQKKYPNAYIMWVLCVNHEKSHPLPYTHDEYRFVTLDKLDFAYVQNQQLLGFIEDQGAYYWDAAKDTEIDITRYDCTWFSSGNPKLGKRINYCPISKKGGNMVCRRVSRRFPFGPECKRCRDRLLRMRKLC